MACYFYGLGTECIFKFGKVGFYLVRYHDYYYYYDLYYEIVYEIEECVIFICLGLYEYVLPSFYYLDGVLV